MTVVPHFTACISLMPLQLYLGTLYFAMWLRQVCVTLRKMKSTSTYFLPGFSNRLICIDFQVHPCGRYRHNTVVFILAKEYNLKNLRTIHRLDRLTSGLLLFGRSPKKARQMEHQIRNRLVSKEYVCRVEGEFPE